MSLLTQEMSDLAGQWIVRPSYVQVQQGASSTQIVGANPLRWALVFAPPGNTGLTIFPDSSVNSTRGIIIGSSTAPIFISYRDFGGLITASWFGSNAVGPGPISISVCEILLQQ